MRTNTPDNAVIVLAISGMTCGGCANTLKRVLERVPGVAGAQVDFGSSRATVAGEAKAQI